MEGGRGGGGGTKEETSIHCVILSRISFLRSVLIHVPVPPHLAGSVDLVDFVLHPLDQLDQLDLDISIFYYIYIYQ